MNRCGRRSTITMSCEHEHHSPHHDHSHVAPVPTSASQLLNLKINLAHVTALNVQNERADWSKIFKTHESRYEVKPVLKSDADEQLIVHIPFLNGSAKVHSIILRTNAVYCPKNIWVWKNSPQIDFDNVEDFKPHFSAVHPQIGVGYEDEDDMPRAIETDSDFVEHFVPRHVFSGVQHLTLFVKDAYDDQDETRLHLVELRGEYSELSKDPVITIYELAANPADHKAIETVGFQMGI